MGKKTLFPTLQIGNSGHGFWPSSNQVETLCFNQYEPNKIFAFSAGSDFILSDYNFSSEILNSGERVGIEIEIKNRGL